MTIDCIFNEGKRCNNPDLRSLFGKPACRAMQGRFCLLREDCSGLTQAEMLVPDIESGGLKVTETRLTRRTAEFICAPREGVKVKINSALEVLCVSLRDEIRITLSLSHNRMDEFISNQYFSSHGI